MNASNSDYAVGRGKPPLHTRFQKGQSGNPSGRPGPAKLARQRFQRALCAALQGNPEELELSSPDNVIAAMVRKVALDACNGRIAAVRLILSSLDAQSAASMEDEAAEQLFTAAEILSLLQGKTQGTDKQWLEDLLCTDKSKKMAEADNNACNEQIEEPTQAAVAAARNKAEPFSLVQGKKQGSGNNPTEKFCAMLRGNGKQPVPRAQLMTGAAYAPPPWAIANEFNPPTSAISARAF